MFESAAVRIGVCVLFGFLLLQPVSLAFAAEVTETVAPEESEPDIEAAPQQEAAIVTAEEPQQILETESEEALEGEMHDVEEATADEEAAEPVPDIISDAKEPSEVTANTELEEVSATETELQTGTDNQQGSASTSTMPAVSESAATTTVQTVGGSSDEEAQEPEGVSEAEQEETPAAPSDETPTEEDQEVTAEEDDSFETETEAATEATTTEAVHVEHNANAYEFDTKECASVGDGAYYCSSTENAAAFTEDGVFAAPDADGDMEIFVRLNGEETQLTSNLIDDNAPYYDALSDRIVWHANYNDRYQIMSYNMRTNEEVRLTNTRYNNMEPVAYGDITMYQAWIDNNWEIMYDDGTELRRLTDNTQQDVSPSIRGGYIVWQSQFADGWQVAVYDQKTEHIEYVKSDGNAKVENPRFVLVYDSTNDEGDVQTLGYDFDNGQAFMLNSIPADLPDELPDPDQTGETRALIQNKNSPKNGEIEELEPLPQGMGTGTSTDPIADSTLDLTASSTLEAPATSTPDIAVADLIVSTATTTAETEDVSHIPDVIIPPALSTSTEEVG